MSTFTVTEANNFSVDNVLTRQVYRDTDGQAYTSMYLNHSSLCECPNCGELLYRSTKCPYCGYKSSRFNVSIRCSNIFSAIDNARMAYYRTLNNTSVTPDTMPDMALAA